MANLETMLFHIDDDIKLRNIKLEILTQIAKFNICIDANGFFKINHSFFAGVRVQIEGAIIFSFV